MLRSWPLLLLTSISGWCLGADARPQSTPPAQAVAAAPVVVAITSEKASIANGLVAVSFDLAKGTYAVTDASAGGVMVSDATIACGDVEGIRLGRTVQVDEVADALGPGKKLVIASEGSDKATVLVSYALHEGSGAVTIGFGLRAAAGGDVRLKKLLPMCDARFWPTARPTEVLTLNGAAGAKPNLVHPLAKLPKQISPNSLMMTGLMDGQRHTIVWGGLANKDFGKYAEVRDGLISLSVDDPVGRLVDGATTYWSEDTFYLDVTSVDPFAALEAYGRAMRAANHARPNVYDFPVLCGWGVGALSKLGNVNNSKALVGELAAAKACGLTRYTKVGIRLEPDTYCYKDHGNTEQGWWDDEHWAKYGHLVPPYATFASWCAEISRNDGVPYTYFQLGMPSDDYARAFPGHMIGNDISRLAEKHRHHQPLVSYDYTDPDFQKRTLAMWQRLRADGMRGIKFDYPETGWRPEGGFEDRHATTAFAYREAFRLCRSGLGPDAFLDERNLGESGRPCLDVTAGLVDTQRDWGDSNKFVPGMVTISGLRWYKNRTVFNYYPDSKTVHDCSPEVRRAMLTMVYLTSGRIDLATSFRLFTPEITHDFSRNYPAYREPFTARPLDAFTGIHDPQVYDLSLTADWHQVAFYNSGEKRSVVSVAISGERVGNAIGLDTTASYYAYDFWSDALIGRLPGNGSIARELEPNTCAMVSVRRALPHPQVLSTNRHVLQGWVDLADVAWDGGSKRLAGTAKVIGGEAFRVTIANNGMKPTAATAHGGSAKLERIAAGDLSVLVLERTDTGDCAWEVAYEP